MNTYYELINYLYNTLAYNKLNDDLLNEFQNFNVYLLNERYQRFINNLTTVLSNRINYFLDKVNECLEDANKFMHSIDNLIEETENQIKLVNISGLIYDEDKEKIISFIKANHKDIVDDLIAKFKGYDNIIEYLKNCYME